MDNNKDDLWLKFMEFGARVGCHQMAERSFFINNRQFPVCARCTGVFIGYALAVPAFAFFITPMWVCLLFCLIMFLDWLIQHLKIRESNNIRRFITGIIGGYGFLSLEINVVAFIVIYISLKIN
ncbi:MAG: DUF2085 domain-containing protein [Ruminococcus sp.]|nr:DUF2085 domain-containing protein [Ruminococcus sp.]MCM1382559.1 DUF2085 domain-containing protein [Muribaculaceae bacterium]